MSRRRPRRLIPRSLRRFVKRLAGLLPEPRDEALLVFLRSGLDLVRGRQPTSATPMDPEVVEFGWLVVDAYERLGMEESRRIFGHELDAWFEYARTTVLNLAPWEAGPGGLSVYENNNNRLRFRRTLDFVQAGDSVFDVGFGRGYLCGLLLRDGGVAAYHGIDVVPEFLEATQRMLAANELNNKDVQIGLGDLFKLNQAEVAAAGATLVICCEVLEHVADPEKALVTLAASLPPGADLLFSVPIHGRLESVWGHVTVFDTARLKSMIERAGLHVHHVEPVANTWTMVVASRHLRPSERVRNARRRPMVNASVPLFDEYDFVAVDPASVKVARSGVRTACEVSVERARTDCQIVGDEAAGTGAEQYGGMAFPVAGLTAVRIEIGLVAFEHILNVYVDAHARNTHVGRWAWKPAPHHLVGRESRRFAFRVGQPSPPFKVQGFEKRDSIDRVEVLAEIQPGEKASFSIRAAYVP